MQCKQGTVYDFKQFLRFRGILDDFAILQEGSSDFMGFYSISQIVRDSKRFQGISKF